MFLMMLGFYFMFFQNNFPLGVAFFCMGMAFMDDDSD